jgi:hypothetical protein
MPLSASRRRMTPVRKAEWCTADSSLESLRAHSSARIASSGFLVIVRVGTVITVPRAHGKPVRGAPDVRARARAGQACICWKLGADTHASARDSALCSPSAAGWGASDSRPIEAREIDELDQRPLKLK